MMRPTQLLMVAAAAPLDHTLTEIVNEAAEGHGAIQAGRAAVGTRNAAGGAGGVGARLRQIEFLHRLGRF